MRGSSASRYSGCVKRMCDGLKTASSRSHEHGTPAETDSSPRPGGRSGGTRPRRDHFPRGVVVATPRTIAVSAITLAVIGVAVACGPAHQDGGTRKPTARPPSRPPASSPGPTRTSVSSTASAGARARVACGTEQLRWRLTRLTANPSKGPTALLSLTNTGATPCTFDGYPDLEVYLGKGPSVDAKPKTTTRVRLLLGHGRTIEIPLFYPAVRLRDGYCAIQPDEDPRISARPPHPAPTDYGASVQMTDPRGRRIRATVCDTIHMGSPRLRPAA